MCMSMSHILCCGMIIFTIIGADARNVKKNPEALDFCVYNKQAYQAGTSFRPDACTFCHCPRDSERPDCAIEDCKYEPNCVKYAKTSESSCCDVCVERGCQDSNGAVYKPGEVVSVTPCITCTCPKEGGRIECSHVVCPAITCVDPKMERDGCCMNCPNGKQCSCYHKHIHFRILF